MTIFKTQSGRVIFKGRVPAAHCANRAIKKAFAVGADTLFAEENGRVANYSFMLRRYYETKSLTPAA